MADPKFDAQWRALIVDDREEELLLPAKRLEMFEAAVIGVVFERRRPSFGKVIGDPRCRCEVERTQTLE